MTDAAIHGLKLERYGTPSPTSFTRTRSMRWLMT